MTTYYVSSEIGNNNNAGTSQNAPLASLQAAANVVKPGDTVQVMNGTYTAPAYGAALDITTSGAASAPITFEAAPGQTPVIDSTGGWNAIDIQASYIVVSGFTVVGGAANYNLQSALAGYGTGNANLDGNGIVVNPSSSVSLPNHITIENNTVSNEPGGGIGIDGADYVQILNNVVHNNANWSAYGTSGITINSSVNLDTNAGPHDIVSGNIVYDNAQLVPSSGVGAITDGEGIILDSNQNYTSEILVENNTVYGNGSAGIESFLTNNATITGNNIYGNNAQNIQSQGNAEILINQSNNNTVTNNTTVNPNVPAPVISNAVANSNGTVTLTGTAVGGSSVAVWDGGQSAVGTATASSTGAWTFTTPDLLPGAYGFTAIDKTAAGGTSAPSVSISATVSTNTGVAAPVISKIAVNSNDSVTLTGTAVGGSTVTVWSTTGDNDGSTTASNTGAWSFTTPDLNPGIYAYTATDTTSRGTSAASTAMGVTVPAATSAAPVVAEILWQNTNGQAAIWELDGTNVIGGGNVGANPGPSWQAIGTGGFNDDGHSDILWQNTNGQAAIWEMNGTNVIGGGNVGANPGPSWKVVGTGDFNDDGHSDILWQNTNGQAAIWEMNGTNVIGGGNVGANPGPSWKVVGTGDFNDDGHSDILWQNTNGQAAIWEMNGTNVIGGGNVGANPGPSWKVVGTGDFNDDGHSDILWQNTNGQVAIWELDGTNVIGGGNVGANPGPSWQAIGTGDFSGDGYSDDILFQNTSSGQVVIWELDGTNVVGAGNVGANPGPSWLAKA